MKKEEWGWIKGYENSYQISSLGRIKSCPKPHGLKNGHSYMTKTTIIKPAVDRNGYLHAVIGGKDKRVHRLVAETFLPNPDGLRDVNHKNGVKTDNRVENLEWVSHSQNEIHKIYVLGRSGKLIRPMKKVVCIETGKTYRSIAEACRELGIKTNHIGEACEGKIKQAAGYHWRFVDGN